MANTESNWRPGMLLLAAGFAAWAIATFITVRQEPQPRWWGVVMLALAAVFCALRARRHV